ncbi:Spy/CpxP family protein refolding chaperone [Psychrobacter sp. CAL346-MNA-CIBAN-0220]|uniref:Spy/CpxP family protein refolding chaperone n=1 Tax=Psychrobacter sp. CAL346-MNA-CIBAN-0220 TaxID=3140457 RepID=UPI0033224A47
MKKLLMGSVLAASSLFAVTACTSVGASTDTTATNSSSMQQQHKGGAKGPFLQLNLTATQQAQIKAIMQSKGDARKNNKESYKAGRAQMQQQMQILTDSTTLDTNAVNHLADQQAAQTKQRIISQIQTQHAISQVLTAEQRQKMAQLKSERQAKGRQHLENRKARGKHQQQGM